jgi:hypothetical protein
MHAYFRSAKRTLDLMKALGAVRFGHFQHGSHHSEIFVDVEKILSCIIYRNLLVTAIFRYIIDNDIRLVIYPSHSSAYMLAGELKQRCDESMVEFIIACRTFKGIRGTSYALTRFSPRHEPYWRNFARNAVLILDDAVCSGDTVKSIIAELVRIDQNYYDSQMPISTLSQSRFSVHIVAFLNRLPRVTVDFWSGLSRIASDRVYFSALISMPIAAESHELCQQCRLEKRLWHLRNSQDYCLYAKEFFSWWIAHNKVQTTHERRHYKNQSGGYYSSSEALKIAGYLSAIERHAYEEVRDNLFETPGKSAFERSISVRVHVRSRAGFLHNLFPEIGPPNDLLEAMCKELKSLIDITLCREFVKDLNENAITILQALTIRYLRIRPTKIEVERVMGILFQEFSHTFNNNLIIGAIASVLDSCLKWYKHAEHRELCKSLLSSIEKISTSNLNDRAILNLDWFSMYLTEGRKKLDSIGEAVRMLSEFAKKGRPNHFYGRHILDDLRDTFRRPAGQGDADQAIEAVRRALISTDQFMGLIRATRVLQSACLMDEKELKSLQYETEVEVQKLKKLCEQFLKNENAAIINTNYRNLKLLFLRIYNRWFPPEGNGRPKAAIIISYFTPNLYDTLSLAWDNFKAQRRPKEQIQIDYTSLRHHRSLKVLIDPVILITAMHQFLDNMDKLAGTDKLIRVKLQLCFHEEDNTHNGDFQIEPGQVGLVVSNNNTPRPDISQIRTRGLSAVKDRLSEYGGGLYYIVPEKEMTFEVTMLVPIWTEVKK